MLTSERGHSPGVVREPAQGAEPKMRWRLSADVPIPAITKTVNRSSGLCRAAASTPAHSGVDG